MKIEILLVISIVVWGLVNWSVVLSVKLLSNPSKILEELEAIDSERFANENASFSDWCLENDFEHQRYFLFHGVLNGPPIECSAWWSSSTQTWALIYVAQMGKNIDFVTIYSDGIGVTTASSKDSLTLPTPPKAFIQALTHADNNMRYAMHQESLEYIEKRLSIRERRNQQDLFAQITESLLDQVSYIKNMRLWGLRGAYWYFISRNLKINKKIHA